MDFEDAADATHILAIDIGAANSTIGAMAAATAIISAAQLDVLVFCDIGMEPASYFLAFQRYASVQIVNWGHPFTSGLVDSIDYYVMFSGAEDLVPSEFSGFDASAKYTEQLVRFDTLGAMFGSIPDPQQGARWIDSFAVREETLTRMIQTNKITLMDGSSVEAPILEGKLFACLQHCGKFHPMFDDVLLQLLEAEPSAVLLVRQCGLDENVPSFETRLSSKRSSGLSERVLVLRDQLPLGEFMRLLGSAHVALEPFPFPASITTLDSFAAGTPVVAHGSDLASRGMAQLSAGLYRRLGIVDCCVASNMSHFISLALALANNVDGCRDDFVSKLEERWNNVFDDREAIKEWENFLSRSLSMFSDADHRASRAEETPLLKAGDGGGLFDRTLSDLSSSSDTISTAAFQRIVQVVLKVFTCGREVSEAQASVCTRVREVEAHRPSGRHQIAGSLQDIAGVVLWALQSSDEFPNNASDYFDHPTCTVRPSVLLDRLVGDEEMLPERNFVFTVAAGVAAAQGALLLDPKLINAAAFAANLLPMVGAWDAAADFSSHAAKLKRPFFWGNLLEKDSGRAGPERRADTFPDDSVLNWSAAALQDPRAASNRGGASATSHPSTYLDSGGEDRDGLRAFRRVQLGGYNSAMLRHLSAQLRYLVQERRVLPLHFMEASDELAEVSDAMDAQRGSIRRDAERDGLLPAGQAHIDVAPPSETAQGDFFLARTLAVLGRSVYLRPTPSLCAGALAPTYLARRQLGLTSAAAAAESEFAAAGVAVVDGLLSPVALEELRAFCEESTFFHKNYIQGYVGAFMGDGFGSAGLLHQLVAELKQAFPAVLASRRLVQVR